MSDHAGQGSPESTGRGSLDFTPPRWAKPAPLGYAQAADAAHFISAPLLAAAGIGLIGVIGSAGDGFRWPGPALLAMSMAVISLVGSIQYGFHARQLLYSVTDAQEWWGEEDFAKWAETIREHQLIHFAEWRVKINRAVTAYNIGITLLGVGAALSAAPPRTLHGLDEATRWAAVVVFAAGTLGEFAWTLAAPRRFSLVTSRSDSGRSSTEE
jgi:hypothetical protein